MQKAQGAAKKILPTAIATLMALALGWTAWAAPPTITGVSFPARVMVGSAASGQLVFRDPDRDVAYARFDVADGRYHQVIVPSQQTTASRDRISFTLPCTPYAQQVTLAVTLVDAAGEKSAPHRLSFSCGQPPVYNFDLEQAWARPIAERIPLNVFILDDGVTALAEGATWENDALLGQPREEVRRALVAEVMPKLSGIWDQCGLGIELAGAWVVQPENLWVQGGTLAEHLFSQTEAEPAIRHGRETGELLRQAALTLWRAAQDREPRAAEGVNVFIVGARILTTWQGARADIEGFSERAWPGYALVRWGTTLENITPKQTIATLAHELGHSLGLEHPEEGDWALRSDPFNLMRGSGVSPQPRANLLEGQCRTVQRTAAQLGALGPESRTAPSRDGPQDESSLRWVELCPEGTCRGRVALRVEAEGNPEPTHFGFARFAYSRDGEHFVMITEDRRYQDGFSALWDTTQVQDGTYVLRATVTDGRGVRALVQVQITVRNE